MSYGTTSGIEAVPEQTDAGMLLQQNQSRARAWANTFP